MLLCTMWKDYNLIKFDGPSSISVSDKFILQFIIHVELN